MFSNSRISSSFFPAFVLKPEATFLEPPSPPSPSLRRGGRVVKFPSNLIFSHVYSDDQNAHKKVGEPCANILMITIIDLNHKMYTCAKKRDLTASLMYCIKF